MNFDMMLPAAALLTQVGGRQIQFNYTAAQKKIITHPLTQMTILFGMFYFSTRSIKIAVGLVLIYYLVVLVLLNEKHPLNILSKRWLAKEGFIEQPEASPLDIYYENMKKLP